MMESTVIHRSIALAAAGLLAAAGSAYATGPSVSSPFLEIRATNSQGTAIFQVNYPSGLVIESHPDALNDDWLTEYAPGSPAPISLLTPGGSFVAQINSYRENAFRYGDPSPLFLYDINLGFNFTAGPEDTTFEIYSTTLTFDNVLNNASGSASAGYVGTDNGDNDLRIIPGLASGYGFAALYNGPSIFRQYLNTSPLTPPPGQGSVGESGNMTPPGSYDAIPGLVSDMSLLYTFHVSAFDQIAGNTEYGILPSPSSLSLIGLGVLATARRRRR